MTTARHPELRKLLRAVCESPRDDLVRLVLADWLDEHDDPERAGFIRVQIGLERAEEGSEDHDRLEARASDLLEGRSDWLWPAADLLDGSQWNHGFRRGFLNYLAAPPGAFVKNAAAIFQNHPVTEVVLTLGGSWGWGRAVGDGRHWHEGADGRLRRATDVLFDDSMTSQGDRALRVPGEVFPHLAKVGVACTLRGSRAIFGKRINGRKVVSRAAVAFAREEAGLPPLDWPD
jgi:uncharacterized protein (TIGR02996 family)